MVTFVLTFSFHCIHNRDIYILIVTRLFKVNEECCYCTQFFFLVVAVVLFCFILFYCFFFFSFFFVRLFFNSPIIVIFMHYSSRWTVETNLVFPAASFEKSLIQELFHPLAKKYSFGVWVIRTTESARETSYNRKIMNSASRYLIRESFS